MSRSSQARAVRWLSVWAVVPAFAFLLWGCSVLGGDEETEPEVTTDAVGTELDDAVPDSRLT